MLTSHAVFTLHSQGSKKYYGYHPHDYEIWKHRIAVSGHGQYYESEKNWYWRAQNGDPELYWMFDGAATFLTKDFQQRVIELNPYTTMSKLRVAFDWMRAWTNGLGKGFDTKHSSSDPDYVPLHDHFNQKDLSDPYPYFEKNRVPGGFTMLGYDDGEWFYPDYIPYDNIPPIDQIPPHLKFRAITCHISKTTKAPFFGDFQQGNGHPLMIPFVARRQPKIPLHVIFKVSTIQDPMKINV